MTAMGMPGVSTWNFGEAFAHLYLDSVAMNHNSIGRGYETFGNGSAETEMRAISPGATSMEWYRPMPAPAQVTWSARDNLNYQETGALIALDDAATHAKDMLRNFYKKVLGFLAERPDPTALRVSHSARSGRSRARGADGGAADGAAHRSVTRAECDSSQGRKFPAGTYVVRLDQPYRNYAVDLLTPQHYPKDGEPPYDDVSWELPANFHLQAIPTADASIREAAADAI